MSSCSAFDPAEAEYHPTDCKEAESITVQSPQSDSHCTTQLDTSANETTKKTAVV